MVLGHHTFISTVHGIYILLQQFFNPETIYKCPVNPTLLPGVDSVMGGFSVNPSENVDSYFSDTLRNHLFNGGSNKPGLDLPALNIQRARDHGIPGTISIS